VDRGRPCAREANELDDALVALVRQPQSSRIDGREREAVRRRGRELVLFEQVASVALKHEYLVGVVGREVHESCHVVEADAGRLVSRALSFVGYS